LFPLALLLSALLLLGLTLLLLGLTLLIISTPLILTLLALLLFSLTLRFLSLSLLPLAAILTPFLTLRGLCRLLRLSSIATTLFLPGTVPVSTLRVDHDIACEDGQHKGKQYCEPPGKNRSHKTS
jgi:hypothetical protein